MGDPFDIVSGIQAVLSPAGPHAAWVAELSWIMFGAGALILLLVVVMTAIALFAPAGLRAAIGRRGTVVVGGIVFPLVVLATLFLWVLGGSSTLVTAGPPALRIEVVGERWWWRVHYLDAEDRVRLVTANEIRIPVGMPVEFRLRTADVIHSFWVPSLAGKLDMIPGRVNAYRFAADKPGIYRGQCAEYCGEQHAKMAFYVVAMEQQAFDEWYGSQTLPAPEPALASTREGAELFLSSGCGACHTVRGTEAAGIIGPDLTHVGSRVSIAAGILPNNRGTLAGWISSAQHLKPGNAMPSFDTLSGPELRSLASYLESLK